MVVEGDSEGDPWPSWPDPLTSSIKDSSGKEPSAHTVFGDSVKDSNGSTDGHPSGNNHPQNYKQNGDQWQWSWWIILIVVVIIVVIIALIIWWCSSDSPPPTSVLDSLLDPKNSIDPK